MKDNLKQLLGFAGSREDIIEKVKIFCKENNYEFNHYDFDYDRIYKAGYENLDNWEDAYICSLEYEINENNEEIYTIVDIII